jgi:hypothetical protein
MGKACRMHVSEAECIQRFGGKTIRRRPLWRLRSRWEDNMKMDLRKIRWVRIWTGFIWLRIETSDMLLLTWQ